MNRFINTIVFSLFVLWSSSAAAGSFEIRDSIGWIPTDDIQILRSEAASWQFDVHILVENATSFNSLKNDAHQWVDGPNVIVIAVDPNHHKTIVRFGNGTGVKSADFNSISAAGNDRFRSQEIRKGFESIVSSAKISTQSTSNSTPMASNPIQNTESDHTVLFVFLALFVIGGVFLTVYIRSKKKERSYSYSTESNPYVSSSYSNSPRSSPVYPSSSVYQQPSIPRQPLTQPIVINQSNGMNDLANLLVVEELLSPRREVVREVVREEPRHSYDSEPVSNSNYDSGGSSSSYDSGSSSYDSGGGSSDFGGGGGGGSDSGGGGSDW